MSRAMDGRERPARFGDEDDAVGVELRERHEGGEGEVAGAPPNARLSIYPSAGHGFLFQYPTEFGAEVNAFHGSTGRAE